MNEMQGKMMRAVWWALGIAGLMWAAILAGWWWL